MRRARAGRASHASPSGRCTHATATALRERTRLARRGAVELIHGRHAGEPGSERRRRACASRERARARRRRPARPRAWTEDAGIEALCAHGRGQVWTRKQAGIAARGTLALDGGRPRAIEALAVIDDTAGYHARHTEWWWSAGRRRGRPTASRSRGTSSSGVNDPPERLRARGVGRRRAARGAAGRLRATTSQTDLAARTARELMLPRRGRAQPQRRTC